MPTDQERLQSVAARAQTYWNDFLSAFGGRIRMEALFEYRLTVNPLALQFFRFCAQQKLGSSNARIVFHSLRSRSPHWSGRAASWLYHAGQDVPVILIDLQCINQRIAQVVGQRRELSRCITKLVLHETGHVVEHWGVLADRRLAGHLPPCPPEREDEAWWFCGLVWGIVLGAIARANRENPTGIHDRAWEHCC